MRPIGRSKVLIIRGGINPPVALVESTLSRHPAVAVVAMPDERLGERVCAYVVPQAGQPRTLPAVTRLLAEHQIAPTYWPERLKLVDALPMMASGKLQKSRLREPIAEKARAEREENSGVRSQNNGAARRCALRYPRPHPPF